MEGSCYCERILRAIREGRGALGFDGCFIKSLSVVKRDGQLPVESGSGREVLGIDDAEGISTQPFDCRCSARIWNADCNKSCIGDQM
ncbi:MAG: hypothetical protein ACRDGI_11240 [Candidatus Limnocylindrales bacterium]